MFRGREWRPAGPAEPVRLLLGREPPGHPDQASEPPHPTKTAGPEESPCAMHQCGRRWIGAVEPANQSRRLGHLGSPSRSKRIAPFLEKATAKFLRPMKKNSTCLPGS